MTADLAAANARYVLTVPQAVLDSKPEVLRIIEDEERKQPSTGPLPHPSHAGLAPARSGRRLPRSIGPSISSPGNTTRSSRSMGSISGSSTPIPSASASSMTTSGSSAVFPGPSARPRWPRPSASMSGKEVVYFPRRSFDIWNTRYFVVPCRSARGWRDAYRGYASFLFETERIYPQPQGAARTRRRRGTQGLDGSIRTSRSCAT